MGTASTLAADAASPFAADAAVLSISPRRMR